MSGSWLKVRSRSPGFGVGLFDGFLPPPEAIDDGRRKPESGLPGNEDDLSAVMRLVGDEISQHVPDVEREVPPDVALRQRDLAARCESELEKGLDTPAALLQRNHKL